MERVEYVEKAILGTIMNDNKLLKETILTAEHFVVQAHKVIYQTMQKLDVKGLATDFATILTELDFGTIESIGGANYLTSLLDFADDERFEKHEAALLGTYRKRKVKNIANGILENDWELDEIMSKFTELETHKENDRVTAFDIAARMLELPYQSIAKGNAVTTGLSNLDTRTGGLQKSDLIIIAARPSVGKTALALNMGINAEQAGTKVIFFSLEMSNKSLGNRLAAHIGNLNLNKMKDPHDLFNTNDINKWQHVIGEMSKMDLIVYDKPGQSVSEMRSKIRKEMRTTGGKDTVVFIDYLQLIQPVNPKATPNERISQISRDLKLVAREFDIPVVCLSQLNRDVEKRDNKRPLMSDLRDSGAIEQDADIILLLYRDGYYKHRASKEANKKPLTHDRLEIDIAKNRQGEVTKIEALYDLTRGVIRYEPNLSGATT